MSGVRALVLLSASLALLLTSLPNTAAIVEGADAAPVRNWTFIIYMAADVTDTLPWEADINEMEAANQADNTNTIVLVDPPGMANTMLLKIEHDDNYFDPEIISTVLEDQGAVIPGGGEVNTGSPAILRDLIVFSATEYPADYLVLVLWGHGAGWRGLCPDGSDLLTLPELRTALTMAEATLNQGLDMVVLDVCNGATMELAYEICESANLLVGSELNVPSEGLPYTEVFDAIASDPIQSIDDFGKAIVDSYIDWAEYNSSHATVACLLDLVAVDDIMRGVDLISEMGLIFNRLYHSSLTNAVHSSEYCEDEWSVDLGTLCLELCAEDLPLEIKVASMEAAQKYFSAIIHYAESNMEEQSSGSTTGLSLYSPSSDTDESYQELLISQTSWMNLSFRLREDMDAQTSGPGPELATGDSSSDDDDLPDFATLTWEQDEEWNYTCYMIHVFRIEPNGLVTGQTISAVDPVVRIDGIVGSLLVSAVACIGDEAYSHQALYCTLSRLVRIDVEIGSPNEILASDIEVTIISQSNERLQIECSDGTCTGQFVAPDWADIGEIVTLQLVDLTSGRILSESRALVSGEDMALTLNVHRTDTDTIESEILLGFVAMIAILGVAVIVHVNLTRKR